MINAMLRRMLIALLLLATPLAQAASACACDLQVHRMHCCPSATQGAAHETHAVRTPDGPCAMGRAAIQAVTVYAPVAAPAGHTPGFGPPPADFLRVPATTFIFESRQTSSAAALGGGTRTYLHTSRLRL